MFRPEAEIPLVVDDVTRPISYSDHDYVDGERTDGLVEFSSDVRSIRVERKSEQSGAERSGRCKSYRGVE